MIRIPILKFATSIIGQLLLVAAATFLLLITGAIYGGNRTLETALLENIKSSVNQTSQLLNITVSTYASNNDVATIQTFLNEMLEENSKNGLTYVIVGDSQGKLLFSTKDSHTSIPTPDDEQHLPLALDPSRVMGRSDIPAALLR